MKNISKMYIISGGNIVSTMYMDYMGDDNVIQINEERFNQVLEVMNIDSDEYTFWTNHSENDANKYIRAFDDINLEVYYDGISFTGSSENDVLGRAVRALHETAHNSMVVETDEENDCIWLTLDKEVVQEDYTYFSIMGRKFESAVKEIETLIGSKVKSFISIKDTGYVNIVFYK